MIFFVLISGSVFSAAILSVKFEKNIPVVFMSYVLLLFIFGVLGNLMLGIYCIFFLSAIFFLVSIISIVIKKNLKVFFFNLCSPCFALFCLIYIFLIIFNQGQLAHNWDEFTYWMDSVKIITEINDFVANPISDSLFQSYPPAIGLWGFLFQKIYQLFHPGEFCEWLVYFAYQLLGLSMLFPLLGSIQWKQIGKNICLILVLLFSPLILFKDYYSSVYVDPMVGILTGAAFAYLFAYGFSTIEHAIYIGSICFTLILAKDVGKYFAIFIILSIICIVIINEISRNKNKTWPGKKPLLLSLIVVLPSVLVYFLWQNVLIRYNVPIRFGNKINALEYIRMLLFHSDMTWRQNVVDLARNALFENRVELQTLGIRVSYFSLLVIGGTVLIILGLKKRRDNKYYTYSNMCARISLFFVFLQAVIYSLFIGAVFIANFQEWEALILASYERYMNISFLPIWIVIIFGFIYTFDNSKEIEESKICLSDIIDAKRKRISYISLLCVVLLLSPIRNFIGFFLGDDVRKAASFRQPYEEFALLIDSVCNENDNIYLISQGNNGQDFWVLKFRVRPNKIYLPGWGGYSIGSGPLYEGDTITQIKTADEFRKILQDDYDYLAIYKLDSTFPINYGSLFLDDIKEGSLYRINKETGKLSLCDK